MSEKSMPFDYDSTAADPSLYEYTATDEREFNMSNFTNGVFPQTKLVPAGKILPTSYLGGSLAVTAAGGMNIEVSPGIAMLEGVKYWNSESKSITLPTAAQEQIIDVVVELNMVKQQCVAKTQARAADKSLADALIRTDTVFQLCLATVIVPASAAEVTAGMITDQRLNTDLAADGTPICGLVGAVSQVDTSVIYNQIMDWFHGLQDVIDENVAVSLQNQINAITPCIFADCTHAKNGTVHTLTCTTLSNLIGHISVRFKATADYEYGDSITLSNGTASVTLTAMTIGGEELPTDGFVNGALVSADIDVTGGSCFFKSGGRPAGTFANRRFFSCVNGYTYKRIGADVKLKTQVTDYVFTAPKTGKYRLTVVGAGGAAADNSSNPSAAKGGGGGAVVIADVILASGENVKVHVDGDKSTATSDIDRFSLTANAGKSGSSGGAGGTYAISPIGSGTGYAGNAADGAGGGSPSVKTLITTVTAQTAQEGGGSYTNNVATLLTDGGMLLCGLGACGSSGSIVASSINVLTPGGVLIEWN